MLANARITASHPSQWQDPYERAFLDARKYVEMTRDSNGRLYSDPSKAPSPIGKKTIRLGGSLSLGVFGICFTSVAETERMWIAARTEGRVRWEIDSDALTAAITTAMHPSPVYLRGVDYKKQEEVDAAHRAYAERYAGVIGSSPASPEWREAVMVPLSVKREEFGDEREQRIVIFHSVRDEARKVVAADRIAVPFDAKRLIRRVVTHPSSTDVEVLAVGNQLAAAGFAGEVSRSPLYKKPNFHVMPRKK
jgi:hypothetical protein